MSWVDLDRLVSFQYKNLYDLLPDLDPFGGLPVYWTGTWKGLCAVKTASRDGRQSMASKLQYTYRSSANMSDEMVEYIKAGVEKAGSFPKFVDALVASNMEDGVELPVGGSAPVAVSAKVDLSPIEEMIQDSRDEILNALAEQLDQFSRKAPVEEVIPAEPAQVPAASVPQPSFREDLVALRRAVATDIVKAKEEEVEKLDEILSAVESMKAPSAPVAEPEPEPVKPRPFVSDSFYEREGDFEEDDYEYARKGDAAIENVTRAELHDLPFDDDDFAAGIGDLIGVSYMDDVDDDMMDDEIDELDDLDELDGIDDIDNVEEDSEEVEAAYRQAAQDYSYDDEIDDETLSGAEVLLGMD